MGQQIRLTTWRERYFNTAVDRVNAARKEAANAASLPFDRLGVTPHDPRHSAVSFAVAEGADVKLIQQMVGHQSAAVTLDVYANLFDKSLDDVVDRLGAAAEAASLNDVLVQMGVGAATKPLLRAV